MLKVFDCFAGYGGAEFALKKAGIEHFCVGFSEIDKFAIQCFQQNHCGENYGNIAKINWKEVPDFDLLTGGFPCQDISNAGKQDLSKGRSILGLELARALREKQPKYFLFENVAAIQQEKFKEFLREMENQFKRAGYQVFRKCLNTKNFGVPQNRERVWFVGYRNDLRKEFGFTPFPQEIGCTLRLKDILEPEVDKKYFLREEVVKNLLSKIRKVNERLNNQETSSAHTLLARDYKEAKCVELTQNESKGYRIYSDEGCSTTLASNAGGLGAKTGLYAISCALRTRSQGKELELNNEQANSITSVQTDSMIFVPTLTANLGGGNQFMKFQKNINLIRRLTPKECFRLMGFLNDEINLQGLSDTQCYKLAGNGWDINIVSLIFKKMEMS